MTDDTIRQQIEEICAQNSIRLSFNGSFVTDIVALLAASNKAAAKDAIGLYNQTALSVMADNPKLDKQVAKTVLWITNGRMAELQAESEGEK